MKIIVLLLLLVGCTNDKVEKLDNRLTKLENKVTGFEASVDMHRVMDKCEVSCIPGEGIFHLDKYFNDDDDYCECM
jgi:hypothetical protein